METIQQTPIDLLDIENELYGPRAVGMLGGSLISVVLSPSKTE